MSHTGTASDSQPSSVERGNSQGTAVPSNGIRPQLHASNGTGSNGFSLSASTSRGLDRIRNSLDLLNWNPSFQIGMAATTSHGTLGSLQSCYFSKCSPFQKRSAIGTLSEFLDCYLEVMVLMPKGRKCITFIGHSILESKREKI